MVHIRKDRDIDSQNSAAGRFRANMASFRRTLSNWQRVEVFAQKQQPSSEKSTLLFVGYAEAIVHLTLPQSGTLLTPGNPGS